MSSGRIFERLRYYKKNSSEGSSCSMHVLTCNLHYSHAVKLNTLHPGPRCTAWTELVTRIITVCVHSLTDCCVVFCWQ